MGSSCTKPTPSNDDGIAHRRKRGKSLRKSRLQPIVDIDAVVCHKDDGDAEDTSSSSTTTCSKHANTRKRKPQNPLSNDQSDSFMSIADAIVDDIETNSRGSAVDDGRVRRLSESMGSLKDRESQHDAKHINPLLKVDSFKRLKDKKEQQEDEPLCAVQTLAQLRAVAANSFNKNARIRRNAFENRPCIDTSPESSDALNTSTSRSHLLSPDHTQKIEPKTTTKRRPTVPSMFDQIQEAEEEQNDARFRDF